MGVIAKHNYREGFLRSEFWTTLRIQVIAEQFGHCFVCGVRNFTHDVHHVFYPSDAFSIRAYQLFALCRRCHDLMHKHTNPSKAVNYRHGYGMFLSALPVLRAITGVVSGTPRRIFTDKPPRSTAPNKQVAEKERLVLLKRARRILYPEVFGYVDNPITPAPLKKSRAARIQLAPGDNEYKLMFRTFLWIMFYHPFSTTAEDWVFSIE